MRLPQRVAVVLPLFVLVAACEPPPPQVELTPEDREAIKALSERYTELLMAGDWDALTELFHSDAINIPPNQPRQEGRAQIRAGLEPDPGSAFTGFSSETQEVDGAGDLAYSRGVYQLQVSVETPEGEMVQEDEGDWIVIARGQADGSWLIYRLIWNSSLPLEMPGAGS